MNTDHLSAWEQEEYLLDQRTPQMLRHLTECAECRAAVERLDRGVAGFRTAAMAWSSECLAARPQQQQFVPVRRMPAIALRWSVAALIPLVLLILALVPFHVSTPPQPVAQISDDALLDQVDEQVSVAVPSSMESLTHLVSTQSSSGAVTSAPGSKHIVQTY
jgi:anti-sigma factor RsiW